MVATALTSLKDVEESGRDAQEVQIEALKREDVI